MPSSARILPNIGNVEKYLAPFSSDMTKPQYRHFKEVMLGFTMGRGSSVLDLSKPHGLPPRQLYYFFNEMTIGR